MHTTLSGNSLPSHNPLSTHPVALDLQAIYYVRNLRTLSRSPSPGKHIPVTTLEQGSIHPKHVEKDLLTIGHGENEDELYIDAMTLFNIGKRVSKPKLLLGTYDITEQSFIYVTLFLLSLFFRTGSSEG